MTLNELYEVLYEHRRGSGQVFVSMTARLDQASEIQEVAIVSAKIEWQGGLSEDEGTAVLMLEVQ